MTRVRTDRSDLSALRIQAKREEFLVWHPKTIIEALLQLGGFVKHPLRHVAVAHNPQHFRHSELGRVNESLLLAGRDGRIHLSAVFIDNRIARILPALIAPLQVRRVL